MRYRIVKCCATVIIAVSATLYVFNAMASSHARVWTPVNSTFKLIFDEEFNGNSLDVTKWNPNWFGSSRTEVTQPVNPSSETAAYDPAQVSVSGGYLHLKTISRPITINGTIYPYRTGHINSNPKASLGSVGFQGNPSGGNSVYMEAMIYIPVIWNFVANWPAWWTTGQNWPITGEIDIAEGLSGGMTANYHSSAGDLGSGLFKTLYSGRHVFAVLWTTSFVTYYYDGVQVQQYRKGIAAAPNYLILQNAIGLWNGPTIVPTDMMVGYVHVYSTDPAVRAVTPEPNYGGPGDAKPAFLADAPRLPARVG